MSTTPRDASEVQTSSQERRHRVVMGRSDFLSVLFRSIRGELYKIRRRRMSKILLVIGILIVILIFGVVALPPIIASNNPPEFFLSPSCTSSNQFSERGTSESCLDHEPTREDLARAAQVKQETVSSSVAPLHLPDSFITAGDSVNFIIVLLLIILTGAIVGGEYGMSTIRLMLTRGPTRTQFFLAKLGAILICITVTVLLLMPIGIATGTLLTLAIPSITVNSSFFTGTWVLHALLYLLETIFGLFVYTMIAFFLSTLGKATAAGVAGAIVWWVLEDILGSVLSLIAPLNKGTLAHILKVIPDYSIGDNISALLTNQQHYLTGSESSAISDVHAVLVLAVYLTIFVGVTWAISTYRDVTN